MLKRKFSNKPDAEDHVPDNVHTNSEKPKVGNEDMEDMDEVDPEMNDTPETDEDTEADKVTVEVGKEIATLQKELSESQDKYLRLAAEFDNYRKRMLREKTELMQTAGESLLKDVLPVVDDFERGLELATQADDMDAVRTGMNLIYNKLKDFLTSHGVKEISAMNEPFNADWHDAVTNIPASDDMKGKIVDVIQKGYTLNDKVMRYPKVVVGE
jgi:molecular chaperone GrpE